MKATKYFIITPVHVAQNCNPGGHFITAGLKWLLSQADPGALYWDVPMYGHSAQTWKLLREVGDVVIMSGHPRFSSAEVAHHWWDTDLWTRIETVVRRDGKKFVDAWAGGSHKLPLKTIDEMGNLIRGRAWVKKILRVESLSTVCITRDKLAQRVIEPSAPHATMLPCNSWFARRYFGVDPIGHDERTHNLIIPTRADGREGVCRKLKPKAEEMTALNGLPTYFVVHSYADLEWCRKNGLSDREVFCVYEPRTLLHLYQQCDLMLSMRIHAAVPGLSLGCQLLYVGTDARLLTIDEFGIRSNRQGVKDNMAFEFKRAEIEPDEEAAVAALRKIHQ